MKTYLATILITGLAGTVERKLEIKAKTIVSANKKVWAIIGNQTGSIIDLSEINKDLIS